MKKVLLMHLTAALLLCAACDAVNATPQPSEGAAVPAANVTAAPDADVATPDVETPDAETPDAASDSGGKSKVYMTADITAEGLQAVYDALEWSPDGDLAVKVSTGEPPNSNYLRQELIGALVASLDGTYVESNTAYGGSRAETEMHYQVAEDHGFTPIVILDEEDSIELEVSEGEVLSGVNYVGARFNEFGSMLVLSHFKGHQMAGFGGAVKNISIGIGSSKGKVWIHSGGARTSGSINGDVDAFQKAMAEAGLSVSDAFNGGEDIVYINVMNRLSVDCDCNGHPREPDIHDIGILASRDPVALDKACLDLIWEAQDNERFVQRVSGRNGFLSLEYGEEIGLGTLEYELETVG
jgi:uncharacterized Fe-S center protein